MSKLEQIKARAKNRWQWPLLLVSIALLGSAILRLRPDPTRLPPDRAAAYLDQLVAGGLHDEAIRVAQRLLNEAEYEDKDFAPVHRALARALFHAATQQDHQTPETASRILTHFDAAANRGAVLTGDDHVARGRAFEWKDSYADALTAYETALKQQAARPLEVRRHMLILLMDQIGALPETASQRLDEFLADVDARLDLRLWGIQRKVRLLEKMGQLDKAATLLVRNRDRFVTSDLRHRFAYWEAWVLYKSGHYDQAEVHLRNTLNRIEHNDPVFAMAGWLLGRTVLHDGGPQRPDEALAFFSEVVQYHPGTPYGVAARIGRGDALGLLERHPEAIRAYRIAIEEMNEIGPHFVLDREALLTSLGVRSDMQRQAGNLEAAVEYARLAAGLIDPANIEQATAFLQQFAQTQVLLAARIEGEDLTTRSIAGPVIEARSPRARDLYTEAASTYLLLAQIAVTHERRAADATWRAAELFVLAGRRHRAIELYEAFVKERPSHALVPRALLRMGQLHQLAGRLPEAIEVYKTCYATFPRTLDGSRALVPLARAYMAMGPDYLDLAEKTLQIVLEDSQVFTPQAPEFADALFLLGDALNRAGRFERAIATLEEALHRYPSDPRTARARYLLADSYRRSGLALEKQAGEAEFVSQIEQMRDASRARFRQAQRLYRRMIDEYERRHPQSLTRLERMYLRHAYLYEADCYFETQDYRTALKLYEQAVGLYKDTTSALAAYVQIINSHVFLGEPDEARAALARAQVLVDALPDRAFDQSVSPETRDDWRRYFDWLNTSELF